MTNLCKEYDKFLSENDARFKELSKENQFYINAIGYGVKYYDLNRRIDKAIKYIENEFDEVGCCVSGSDLPYSYIEELLDILKGDDKE